MVEQSKIKDEADVKRRKASCAHCRQRKSKCDGRHPACSTCIAYKTVCKYDKPPSIAYVRSLEAKVESLTNELRRLNADISATSDLDNAGVSSESFTPQLSKSPSAQPQQAFPWADTGEEGQSRERVSSWASEIHNSTSTLGESGPYVTAQRSTAFPLTSTSTTPDPSQKNQERLMLLSNAATQRRHEETIVGNMASHGDLPKEVTSELLNLHWCWIHPLFLFVYRPAFIRNMAAATAGLNAPYFSETLLNVMLGHTGRFLANSSGPSKLSAQQLSTLSDRAHRSLGFHICDSSSVPMMQALLQQSAREVAFGNSSQAWLYSGMAFRMAVDLGIHLPSVALQSQAQTLTAEDVEVRKRLFWSCYNWDKIMSLYFGRMPSFLGPVPKDPIVFMDDYTENEAWQPYYGYLSEDSGPKMPQYPPTEGRVISTFTALCKLSTILSMVMLEIYGTDDGQAGSRTPGTKAQSFSKINSALRQWWKDLPTHLALLVTHLPALSPPPHIVSLNLLYHTTSILLHRPFVVGVDAAELQSPPVQKSYQVCLTAAGAIHDLLKLQVETFGYRHVTYPNSYAAYIAATIAILNYQFEEETGRVASSAVGQKLGLKFFLDVLQGTAKTMPASGRSLAFIRTHMQTVLERSTKKKLASLFPDLASAGSIPTSQQQPIPKYSPSQLNYALQAPLESTTSQPTYTANASTSYTFAAYNNFGIDSLPAFPGQQYLVAPDYRITSDNSDPETRAAFLGQHLDPHLSLQHENNDWDTSEYFMLEEVV